MGWIIQSIVDPLDRPEKMSNFIKGSMSTGHSSGVIGKDANGPAPDFELSLLISPLQNVSTVSVVVESDHSRTRS